MHTSDRFPRARRCAPLVGLLGALIALGGCGGDQSPQARRTQVEVAVHVPAGSPADRHWDTYVKSVVLWAPEFTVTRVARPPNGLAGLGQGRVQVMHLGPGELATVLPELAVLERPLLFASDAEADHVLDRVLLTDLEARLRARGHRLLGWTEGEPRVAYVDAAGRATFATLAAHAAGTSSAPPGTSAVLLDSGHVPGLILAAPAWYDPLSPHDADVFAMAYGLPAARADTRRESAETVATLAGDAARAVRAPTPEEFSRWRVQWATAPAEPAARALLATIEQARAAHAEGVAGAEGAAAAASPGAGVDGPTPAR